MAAIRNLCQKSMLLNQGYLIEEGFTIDVIEKYVSKSIAFSLISLFDRKDRKGDGSILFTGVSFHSENDDEVKAFHTGQNAKFIIHFKNCTQKELKNLSVALCIDNYMGERIAILYNDLTDEVFNNVSLNITKIEIIVEHLPLVAGKYGFTLFSKVNNVIGDWIQNAGFFDVEEGDFYGTGRTPPEGQGFFLMNHKFKIVQ